MMRRRVLIVSPFPPTQEGLHGGSQVVGRLLSQLADKHSVAVAYLRARYELPIHPDLAAKCEDVAEVAWPGTVNTLGRRVKLLTAWIRGYPLWAEDWRIPAFRGCLRELVRRFRPDLMQFEFHIMAQYAEPDGKCPSVLVEHEPGGAAARDRFRFSRGLRRLALYRDFRAWEAYERRALSKFKAIVCFAEMDRRKLMALVPRARIEVITPPLPEVIPTEVTEASSTNTVLFAGNFVHPPNIDAAVWLATEIFPKVREQVPDAVLHLVGDAPPAAVQKLAGNGVLVTGRVPDVGPFLASATAVAAPLRIGGGIRVKVLDALAAGKPLVATPLAASGIGLTHGYDALLASGTDEFAADLVSVLADAPLRRRLAQRARHCAERIGAPGRALAAFEKLYESIVN
jgi:polysaccharide biosynthesis protein PslH